MGAETLGMRYDCAVLIGMGVGAIVMEVEIGGIGVGTGVGVGIFVVVDVVVDVDVVVVVVVGAGIGSRTSGSMTFFSWVSARMASTWWVLSFSFGTGSGSGAGGGSAGRVYNESKNLDSASKGVGDGIEVTVSVVCCTFPRSEDIEPGGLS